MADPRGPRRLDLDDPETLRCLWDLQRAAYAVEAELIGFDGIPPLHESLAELYRRRGFEPVGTRLVGPGTTVTLLARH